MFFRMHARDERRVIGPGDRRIRHFHSRGARAFPRQLAQRGQRSRGIIEVKRSQAINGDQHHVMIRGA
jgi:hypothetical protein